MNRRNFITATSASLAAAAITPGMMAAEPVVTATDSRYQPGPKPTLSVVKPGEFVFAAAHLDHSHIDGMCRSIADAGGTIKWVFEPDARKAATFAARYPAIKLARSLDEILSDPEVKMVAAAAVTSERGPLGCRVMEAGKDYFTDKAPLTTLPQLEQAKAVSARTNRKFMVYYSERLTNESAMFATDLVQQGAIGRILQVVNLAPHRLSASTRPDWFWVREKFGGILCDIGSHQFEQFLAYSGAKDVTVMHAAVAGKVGYKFFGQLILDCLNRAENAMTQAHAFKAAEVGVKAQSAARRIG